MLLRTYGNVRECALEDTRKVILFLLRVIPKTPCDAGIE